MMYQNNRRLFPIIAVLTAAGAIIGICGIAFVAVDHVGGKPLSVPNQASPSPGNTGQTAAAKSSAAAASPLKTRDASVLSLATLDIANDGSLNAERSNHLLIASGSDDNTVKIWEEGTGQKASQKADPKTDQKTNRQAKTQGQSLFARESLAHNGYVDALAFIKGKGSEAPAGDYRLITGSGSGEIKLWNPLTGELIATIADRAGRITSLAVNAEGTSFASGSSNGTLKIWPVKGVLQQKSQTIRQGKAIAQLKSQINTLAFNPQNSNLVVSGDQAGTIQVWDIQQSKSVLTIASGANRITSLSISPDGQYVASGSYDKLIRIWNLETGTLIRTLSDQNTIVADVVFSPDDQLLASTSDNQSIKLWDWAQAKELCTLSSPSDLADTLAFSADGGTLVSGGHNGTVKTWDLTAPNNQGCLKKGV